MAIFKCKMCGGALEIKEGMSVCECQYCGTLQTLPNLDDEKKIRLYDRANHFRRNNEFDKAMGIYESILEEDNEDAEAYWSLVLCRYGIEYVEDPATHKRVPTVNRAQYTSVFIDEDYQSALKYADGYQRDVYESEANAIDEIQKGILEISNKEDPFDVFICYKETDLSGRRTEDSVYAQDIYKALTDEGYKVFFSRITLEDKLGTEYEPYIFAALHSAPVMIAVGTNAENLNSVWVKNEWSRYLALVKAGENKTLIPVYKNMDPYDLPEEFSYLQAQDMNKVGFMQDLIRGVKKIVSQDVVDERQKKGTSSVIVDTMTKRGGEALANGDWDTAVRCYDSILDYDNKNIEALIGKLKAVKQVQNLEDSATPLEGDKNYQKLLQFADEETRERLESTNNVINERLSALAKTAKKRKIVWTISITLTVLILLSGLTFGLTYNDYIKPAIAYRSAESLLEAGKYDEAKDAFSALGDFKDSKDKVNECGYAKTYSEAMGEIDQKDYKAAIAKFDSLEKVKYSDAAEKLKEYSYLYAIELLNNKDYEEALEYLEKCKDYKDAADRIKECNEKVKEASYKKANNDLKEEIYGSAIERFEALGDYKDSKDKLKQAKYGYVIKYKGNSEDVGDSGSKYYRYITELKNAKYKDTESIYNSLYNSWGFKCWVNDSGDSSSSKTSINKNSSVYVHVEATHGPIDESANIRIVVYRKSEFGDQVSFEDTFDVESFSDNYSSFAYSTPAAVTESSNEYVKIYNEDTGALIDTISFRRTV